MVAKTSASKKAKGRLLETQVAKRFHEKLGVEARRMPMSGAITGFKGDIYLPGLPLSVECKRQEKVQIWKAFQQACDQCGLGKTPVLIIDRNYNKDALAVLKFEDLLDILKVYMEQYENN
jgi:hypothetical protein